MVLESIKENVEDIKTLLLLIFTGLMVVVYGLLVYGFFTNPDNGFYGSLFISIPVGVMFLGIPLVLWLRDDEDLVMGVVIIGAIIFLVGLALAGMTI